MTDKAEYDADHIVRGDHTAIVVGVDGSPHGQEALEWAAAEASTGQRPLHIVHGFTWPMMGVPFELASLALPDARLQAAAEAVLLDAETRARDLAPDVKVTTELVMGSTERALLQQAHDAEMIVVGSQTMHAFTELFTGSGPATLAAHASCPLIIVHRRTDQRSPASRVVVGTDGSDASEPAVDFAFEAAARHGASLTAVHAWSPPTSVFPEAVVAQHERERLLGVLEAKARRFPQIEVEVKLVDDDPGRALTEESADAELIVVGSRGRGGLQGLLLGSVSQTVLHDAECPVAVVGPHAGSTDLSTDDEK